MGSGLTRSARDRATTLPKGLYFTVKTALSLMNPAVVAVIVALPTVRPVAIPRSLTVAFSERFVKAMESAHA